MVQKLVNFEDNFGLKRQIRMDQQQISKLIIYVGLFLVLFGAIYYLFGDKFRWLGNLPGDIKIEKENFKFYFPITTMLLLSLIVNALIRLFRHL